MDPNNMFKCKGFCNTGPLETCPFTCELTKFKQRLLTVFHVILKLGSLGESTRYSINSGLKLDWIKKKSMWPDELNV